MIIAAQLDQPRMASIRDIADLSDSMRFKNFMDLFCPGLWLAGFPFFGSIPYQKFLRMVTIKTIFYKSLDLPASSGFKKIQQGLKSNIGNELFESGG